MKPIYLFYLIYFQLRIVPIFISFNLSHFTS